MYKIIGTTDKKFIGRLIEFNAQNLQLDDFLFKIENVKYMTDGTIELSNPNYIMLIKMESEL